MPSKGFHAGGRKQVGNALANLNRPRGRRPYSVGDCCLRFEVAEPPPQPPDEVVQHLERFFARYERGRRRAGI